MKRFELIMVPPEEFKKTWPFVQKHFNKLVDTSHGRMKIYPMAVKVLEGDWQLWVVWDNEKHEAQAITFIPDKAS